MHSKNEVELSFDARSVNEGFARMAVAAFVAELNPTLPLGTVRKWWHLSQN